MTDRPRAALMTLVQETQCQPRGAATSIQQSHIDYNTECRNQPGAMARQIRVVVTYEFPDTDTAFFVPHPSSQICYQKTNSTGFGKAYYFGYALSFIAAAMLACGFVINQILDDVSSVFQLNFGKFLCLFGVTVVHLVVTSETPQLVLKANLLYLALFISSTLLDTVFGFQAVTHIAVGTAYAVESICFLSIVILFRVLKALCAKLYLQPLSIGIDIAAVCIVSLGVLFIVQPDAIFHGIEYFSKTNDVYTSVCNPDRFALHLSSNASSSATDLYKSHSAEGYLLAALAGLCCAIKVVSGQKLLEEESLHTILFWTSLINSAICFCITAVTQGFTYPSLTFCFIILFVHAFTTGVQTYLFYIGLSYISATDVAIAAGFVLPLLFLCQFTFLSSLSPTPRNAVAAMAAILVLLAIVGKPLLQGFLAYKGYLE